MDTIKTIAVSLATALVAVLGFNAVSGGENLGAVPGVNLIPLQGQENTIAIAQLGSTSTVSIGHEQSGSTFYLSASGTVLQLPAPRDGDHFKFTVKGAIDSANMAISSTEGDNIEGSLIVAGAVVDCNANDLIEIVADGENLGDFVELRSDGTKWFVTTSNALTASKMTCSG